MNKYIISPIEEKDIAKTNKVAEKAFGFGVSIILPKKNIWGFYAHDDESVVGAVYMSQVADDEGVLEWIFVDPIAQGHRIGIRLLSAALEAMDKKGLTKQFALVKDTNTASWNMFAKNGYVQPSVFYTFTRYSIKSLPKRLNYSMVTGYSIWVKDPRLKTSSLHPRKFSILKTYLFALFIGACLSLFSIRGTDFLRDATLLVTATVAVRMLVSYPITRLYGKVRWDAPQGATLLSIILALLGTWWPTFGSFVPKEDYWNINKFRKYDAWAHWFSWMSVVGLYIGSSFLLPDLFIAGFRFYLSFIIIVLAIPTFPLDAMDGARIFTYNKWLYLFGIIIAVASMILFY